MIVTRDIKVGDLVTDRTGKGAQIFQHLFTPQLRHVRLFEGEVGLVTGMKSGRAQVLFKGQVWQANPSLLQVVSDGERG